MFVVVSHLDSPLLCYVFLLPQHHSHWQCVYIASPHHGRTLQKCTHTSPQLTLKNCHISRRYIEEAKCLSMDTVRSIMRQILAGVLRCHELQIIHRCCPCTLAPLFVTLCCRDLKPSNIVIDAHGQVMNDVNALVAPKCFILPILRRFAPPAAAPHLLPTLNVCLLSSCHHRFGSHFPLRSHISSPRYYLWRWWTQTSVPQLVRVKL